MRPVDPFSNLHAAKTLGSAVVFFFFFRFKTSRFWLLFFLVLGMMDHHGSWWIMMDHEEFEHPLNQSDLILRLDIFLVQNVQVQHLYRCAEISARNIHKCPFIYPITNPQGFIFGVWAEAAATTPEAQ